MSDNSADFNDSASSGALSANAAAVRSSSTDAMRKAAPSGTVQRGGFAQDAVNWVRGVCMGAADIVPGVSGGTVALILGHYERLVSAIGNIDQKFLGLLISGKLRAALERIDFRFLVGLGAGIATGIVALASAMHWLLEHQLGGTYAVFLGLILGSSYLVGKRLSAWKVPHAILLIVGAIVAVQISVLNPMHGELTPLTAFGAATIAICAMILPGISGAFILLLLGLYHPVTELIKGLPHGEFTLMGLLNIACFMAGCLVGLLAFTRLLKWLLAYRHDGTMAFLVGLMLGSLLKIWPFQRPTAASVDLPFKEQQFELLWPSQSETSLMLVIVLALIAAAATLLLERVGTKFSAD